MTVLFEEKVLGYRIFHTQKGISLLQNKSQNQINIWFSVALLRLQPEWLCWQQQSIVLDCLASPKSDVMCLVQERATWPALVPCAQTSGGRNGTLNTQGTGAEVACWKMLSGRLSLHLLQDHILHGHQNFLSEKICLNTGNSAVSQV